MMIAIIGVCRVIVTRFAPPCNSDFTIFDWDEKNRFTHDVLSIIKLHSNCGKKRDVNYKQLLYHDIYLFAFEYIN